MGLLLISSPCVKHEALTPHLSWSISHHQPGVPALPAAAQPLRAGALGTWCLRAAHTPPPARCSPGPAGPAQGSQHGHLTECEGCCGLGLCSAAAGAAASGRRLPCTRALEAQCGLYLRRLLVGQWQILLVLARFLPQWGLYNFP